MTHTPTTLLSEKSRRTLDALATSQNRPAELILDDAIADYAERTKEPPADWKERILQAAGMWKDRTDLPDFEELRRSADRDVWKRGADE